MANVRPRYERSRDWDDVPRRSVRRQAEPQGMTTGVKLLICGAIASILLIGGLFAVLVVAAAMAPVAGPMGGGGAPPPGPPPGARFGNNPQQIPQTNSYTISFTKPDEEESIAPAAISGKPIFKTRMQPNANRRFMTGPANATQTMSRFGFRRL